MNNRDKMRNLLVQYPGGGYDGCIWEWNFFWLDQRGEFHDIFSSGCGAITTADKALDLLQGNDKFYVYDLDCPTSVDEFSKETNPGLIQYVIGWFLAHTDIELYNRCGQCETKIYEPAEMHFIDFKSQGGIVVAAENVICSECYAENSCSYCGEYCKDDLVFSVKDIEKLWDVPAKIAHDVVDNYAPVCYSCCQDLLNREIDQCITAQKKVN